jgi:hypothetical protein
VLQQINHLMAESLVVFQSCTSVSSVHGVLCTEQIVKMAFKLSSKTEYLLDVFGMSLDVALDMILKEVCIYVFDEYTQQTCLVWHRC